MSLYTKFYCPDCNKVLKRSEVKKWNDCRLLYHRCTFCGRSNVPTLKYAMIGLLKNHNKKEV